MQKKILDNLVNECVHDWIMSGNLEGYSMSRKLWKSYNQSVMMQEIFAEKHWEIFAKEISQHEDVIRYIEEKNSLSVKSIFKDKFYNVLSQDDDTLQGLIASLPTLQVAFTEYNRNINIDFNWQQISEPIREEFAAFISSPRTWLAPAELHIIACIFDKTIEYYPSPEAKVAIINPDKSDVVSVQFDGVNHFERIDRDYLVAANSETLNHAHKLFKK